MLSLIVPNQSENGKYNLISVWYNKISQCAQEICAHKNEFTTRFEPKILLRKKQREILCLKYSPFSVYRGVQGGLNLVSYLFFVDQNFFTITALWYRAV